MTPQALRAEMHRIEKLGRRRMNEAIKKAVLDGTLLKTKGGLYAEDLMINSRGKAVSKAKHNVGVKQFGNIEPYIYAKTQHMRGDRPVSHTGRNPWRGMTRAEGDEDNRRRLSSLPPAGAVRAREEVAYALGARRDARKALATRARQARAAAKAAKPVKAGSVKPKPAVVAVKAKAAVAPSSMVLRKRKAKQSGGGGCGMTGGYFNDADSLSTSSSDSSSSMQSSAQSSLESSAEGNQRGGYWF